MSLIYRSVGEFDSEWARRTTALQVANEQPPEVDAPTAEDAARRPPCKRLTLKRLRGAR